MSSLTYTHTHTHTHIHTHTPPHTHTHTHTHIHIYLFTFIYVFFYLACCPVRNIILNNVRQHNYFTTQSNYIGYMFRLLFSHLQAYFVNCVTRCYAHIGIPSCLHSWNTWELNHLSQRCDVQIVFTTFGYIKLDHVSRKICYTNRVIKS